MAEKGEEKMNREILFRGKRVDNGEWIESLTLLKLNEHLYMFQTAWGEITYDLQYNITAIFGRKKPFLVKIIPETCGEYTGLTDKNGKKIFEGDILDLTYYMIMDVGVVKFGEYKDLDMGNDYPCGHVGFYVDVEKQRNSVRKDILFFAPECKVIGNIHDNPELLGGET